MRFSNVVALALVVGATSSMSVSPALAASDCPKLVELANWGENPTGDILLTSRDNRVSYPVCVYPLRTTWNGSGPATQATSYSCR